jgi:hypothetical protein
MNVPTWQRKRFATFVLAGCALWAGAAAALGADGISLSTTPRTTDFGRAVTLSGKAGSAAGGSVDVLSQACGFTEPVVIETVKTRAGGTYSFSLEPSLNTRFVVRVEGGATATVSVHVRPLVQIRRITPRRLVIDVSVGAGQFFTGPVVVEAQAAGSSAWHKIGQGKLHQASDAGALVAVSSGSIITNVPKGGKIRGSVGAATLGPCYVPAKSLPLGT